MTAQRPFGFLTLLLWCLNITARGDVVTEWNLAALDAIRAQNTPPPAASRHLAILHAAVYDAVNGIRRTHAPFKITGKVQASASVESAAVAAARTILVNLYPTLQPSLNELQSRLLAGIPNGPEKMHGLSCGAAIGTHVSWHLLRPKQNESRQRSDLRSADLQPSWSGVSYEGQTHSLLIARD